MKLRNEVIDPAKEIHRKDTNRNLAEIYRKDTNRNLAEVNQAGLKDTNHNPAEVNRAGLNHQAGTNHPSLSTTSGNSSEASPRMRSNCLHITKTVPLKMKNGLKSGKKPLQHLPRLTGRQN